MVSIAHLEIMDVIIRHPQNLENHVASYIMFYDQRTSTQKIRIFQLE